MHVLDLLHPRAVTNGRFARVGSQFDGGYVMVEQARTDGAAYSFGIGGNIDWDRHMADAGHTVFQYDHTVRDPAPDDSRMVFFPFGIDGHRSMDGRMRTLEDLLRSNGHQTCDDLILKMDVEGSEWPVLSTIGEGTLAQFTQIVVELHGLAKLGSKRDWRKVEPALRAMTLNHVPVHIHGNNCSRTVEVNGRPFPNVLEVTLLRKDQAVFADRYCSFPTELDAPNDPNLPEIILGRFVR